MARAKSNKDGPRRPAKSGRGSSGRRSTWWGRLFRWGLLAAIWFSLGLGALIGWYAYDLPDVSRIAEVERRPSVTLIAANGSRFASFGDIYGETVRLRDLPPYLPQAVLAVEDRNFYEHFGIDPMGLLRAAMANFRAGRIVQGGSTISQQLAKILFLEPDRTLKRKVQEMLLAFWLERKFSKDQILTLYLNRVYLGAGTYGVDAAAGRYFNKRAAEVTLYEAAMLAGLLKAPSRYNPARDQGLADARTQRVLAAMVDAGSLSAAKAAKAYLEKRRGRAPSGRAARYFSDWVLNEIKSFVGNRDRDLIVVTTLDPRLQDIAEQELTAMLDLESVPRQVKQAAFVALSPEGAVRAMVGGRDYRVSQFNRAVQALRQPGSAFKPFVYLAALERGFSPDDRFDDAPIRIGDWAPRNYADRYYGVVTLREAFARSLNSVAVRLSEGVGRQSVVEVARRLGVISDLDPSPSIALGTSEVSLLELTGAYAAFANQGFGVWPYGIEEIRESTGRILYRRDGGGLGRVVRPEAVNTMNQLMSAVVDWGTGKAANPGRPAAGKTGTSQGFRDAWFIGYTSDLVAGAWFGNDDGSPMKRVTGGSLPARLWSRVVARGSEGIAARPLPGAPMVVAGKVVSPDDARGVPAGRSLEEDIGIIARILRGLSLDLDFGDPKPKPPDYYD